MEGLLLEMGCFGFMNVYERLCFVSKVIYDELPRNELYMHG